MKNQKGFIQIIIILVVLAAIAGAYYFGTKNKQNVVSEVPTASPTIKPTTDPTANWKTYTTSKLIFKLPTSFNLTTNYLDRGFAEFESNEYKIKMDLNGLGFGIECIKEVSRRFVKVGGREITETIYQESGAVKVDPNITMCEDSSNKNYYFSLDLNPKQESGDIFVFSFNTENVTMEKAKDMLDQILSTFKFTN